MTYTEIREALNKLSLTERLSLMEDTLQLMREELQLHEPPPTEHDRKAQQLAAAAKALLPDYTADRELTGFTALDSEDFHETR
ncbi:hypothetical protein [Candidatus Entotheonella palauensis]|uniref:Uncharacterized protein n=1 Tax=Candidatus Entotheonella gemina TaxID=1429439 RepID=W4LNB2_9BACT|nr:hypothetical protein [Candidatus Entotheonella palauensis]ETW99364.1 MAG: hypothetical protein ETSY2_41040 [Candidatus Entotheonella gemina]